MPIGLRPCCCKMSAGIVQSDGYIADLFMAPPVLYDEWSIRKFHRATLLAPGFTRLVQQLMWPLGGT
jgi:hypothetical protein